MVHSMVCWTCKALYMENNNIEWLAITLGDINWRDAHSDGQQRTFTFDVIFTSLLYLRFWKRKKNFFSAPSTFAHSKPPLMNEWSVVVVFFFQRQMSSWNWSLGSNISVAGQCQHVSILNKVNKVKDASVQQDMAHGFLTPAAHGPKPHPIMYLSTNVGHSLTLLNEEEL